MVSGQFYYESVRAGIRMTIIIPNIEDGNATLAIDLPQSELESFVKEPTSNLRSTSLPSGSGYCVASYQAQVYKCSLEMSSNAIALYGSDTAQSSNLSHITVRVALPHVAGFECGMLNNASQVSANCSAGQNASKVVICPDGSNYTVPCGNASGTWDVTCPASYLVPTCNLLDGVVVGPSNEQCVVDEAASTPSTLSCSCIVPLYHDPEISHPYVRAEFVAMTETVINDFIATWKTADDLTVKDLSRSWKVLDTLGLIAVVSVCGLVGSDKADVREVADFKKGAEKVTPAPMIEKWRDLDHSDPVVVVGALFPAVFLEGNLCEHICARDEEFSLMGLSLLSVHPAVPEGATNTHISINCDFNDVFNALLYNLVNPDDGTCQGIDNEMDCVKDTSSYSTYESKCYCTETRAYREPSNSFQAVFIITVVCALLSLPLVGGIV
jgi:hypothetical protein